MIYISLTIATPLDKVHAYLAKDHQNAKRLISLKRYVLTNIMDTISYSIMLLYSSVCHDLNIFVFLF